MHKVLYMFQKVLSGGIKLLSVSLFIFSSIISMINIQVLAGDLDYPSVVDGKNQDNLLIPSTVEYKAELANTVGAKPEIKLMPLADRVTTTEIPAHVVFDEHGNPQVVTTTITNTTTTNPDPAKQGIDYTTSTITNTPMPNQAEALQDYMNSNGSSTITVYHDTDPPKNGSIINIKSDSYNPIIDFLPSGDSYNQSLFTDYSIGSSGYALTKDTSIIAKFNGEQQADVQYELTKAANTIDGAGLGTNTRLEVRDNNADPKNTQYLDDVGNLIESTKTAVVRNGKADNPSVEVGISLSANKTEDGVRDDQNQNCYTVSQSPIKNRRIGICNDGVYGLTMRMVDTAGNRSAWIGNSFERDTVAPDKPNLQVTKGGSRFNEQLSVNVNGETGTEAYFYITSSLGETKTKATKIDTNGNYSAANIWGRELVCGGNSYTVNLKLKDRAGNISQSVSATVTTGECAVCTTSGTGQLMYPVQNPASKTSSQFGTYVKKRGGAHAGIDLTGNLGDNVLAADNGVVESNAGAFEAGGWGNFIILRHSYVDPTSNQNYNLLTVYAHLQYPSGLSKNTTVSRGQTIGKLGSTGYSTGPHLHFQVEDSRVSPDPAFIGRYHQYGPVDPTDFMGNIQGNVSGQQEIESECINSGFGDSVPDFEQVEKDEAVYAVTKYIMTALADETELEIWSDGGISTPRDKTPEYIKIGDLQSKKGVNKGDFNQLQNFISQNVYLDFGKFESKSGIYLFNLRNIRRKHESANSGYDGAIVVNQYRKEQNAVFNDQYGIPNILRPTAVMVKNAIWEKYRDILDNNEAIVGIPMDDEVGGNNFEIPVGSSAVSKYYQGFQRGYQGVKYDKNIIYYYSTANGSHSTNFVVNKVANFYNQNQGSLKMPTGDTFSDYWPNNPYCKQYFEGGVIDLCEDLTSEKRVYAKNGSIDIYPKYYLSIIQTPDKGYSENDISENPNKDSTFRYNYNTTTSPKVWIVSHGQNNTWKNMLPVSDAIRSQSTNDVIINLDWSDCAIKPSPTDTDQCIRPIAEDIAKRLKKWGLTDASKLNMVGHSMGTFMVTEISRALGNSENIGETAQLILLDPPKFLLAPTYLVDDRSGSSEELYNEGNGYRVHARVKDGKIQAFSGIKRIKASDNGKVNWCGNVELNRTADQSISMYFTDLDDSNPPAFNLGSCSIHGAVVKAWSKLVSSKKIKLDGESKIGIEGVGVWNNDWYKAKKFYVDDNNFKASITIQGVDDVQFIQTFDGGTFNQWEKDNEGTTFRDFDSGMNKANSPTTIRIRNFNNPDSRISLENGNSYDVVGNTITRSKSGIGGFNRYDDIRVEGSRSGEVSIDSLNQGDPRIFLFR